MRKFRLKNGDFAKSFFHEYGEAYELVRVDSDGDFWLKTIESYGAISDFAYFPKEVDEVFEHESKPLHKDTDLGYYAGLAMQGMLSNPNTANLITSSIGRGPTPEESLQIVSSTAKAIAKELIKQLDKEST